MRRIRVIPVLLLKDGGLVKSVKFKDYRYVGDPINAVRIFNDKYVDEIAILDISASKRKQEPNIDLISEIASEAFMPLSYGGGISTVKQIEQILYNGVEKVTLNYNAFHNPTLITEAAKQFGSQSIVVSIDAKKGVFGKYKGYTLGCSENTGSNPLELAKKAEDLGAGEIFLNSINQDGTYQGYDLELINQVSKAIGIPLIACGGAGTINDFSKAVKKGASAVAAGSMFVFQRPHQAVLISYPTQLELENFYESI